MREGAAVACIAVTALWVPQRRSGAHLMVQVLKLAARTRAVSFSLSPRHVGSQKKASPGAILAIVLFIIAKNWKLSSLHQTATQRGTP